MHSFGVIRSSMSGEALRLALNYDNDQAALAGPGGNDKKGVLDRSMQAEMGSIHPIVFIKLQKIERPEEDA